VRIGEGEHGSCPLVLVIDHHVDVDHDHDGRDDHDRDDHDRDDHDHDDIEHVDDGPARHIAAGGRARGKPGAGAARGSL
jgi:hypothetical protein